MSYVSVRTATLRPDTELLFDVYVLYQDTYLKYRNTSDKLDVNTLNRFKLKKVKKIFIPEEQEPDYLEYLDQALKSLTEGSENVEAKAEFAQDTLKQESENVGKALESEQMFRSTESRIQSVVDFMLSEPKALANMLASAGLSVDDSAHGGTVASLVLGLGTGSGTMDRNELTDLAVASLLHDTSLKSLGFEVSDSLESIAKEKRADFRRHPAVAVEQVAGKKFITPRVLRIIQDHEEYGDGKGFPEKKRYAKLQADSKIFNLCDAFDHFCVKQGKSSAECIEAFVQGRGADFDANLVKVLQSQLGK